MKMCYDNKDAIIIGVVTDVHYADSDTIGTRYYRDSLLKVHEAVDTFIKYNPSFCIDLGDAIDTSQTAEIELGCLKAINEEYARFDGDFHHVLGNHDLASFSKEQFLKVCGAKNYYSFDNGSFHFVILDACYNLDESDYNAGNFDWTEACIPAFEQEWLKSDLQNTSKKTIVFVHQRLDDDNGAHGVKNAPLVRQILEESGNVLAVLQGHDHQGAYNQINGIHYFTFQAVVVGLGIESNSYSLVNVHKNSTLCIEGFGKQRTANFLQ